MTRQQSRKESKKSKPLCVPEIINSDISPDDIEAEQNEDETLVKIWTMVGPEDDDSRFRTFVLLCFPNIQI